MSIPAYTRDALLDYIKTGNEHGGFVMAVLENDLKSAVGKADHENKAALCDIVEWLWNGAPTPCWGSPEKVKAWMKLKRFERDGAE